MPEDWPVNEGDQLGPVCLGLSWFQRPARIPGNSLNLGEASWASQALGASGRVGAFLMV